MLVTLGEAGIKTLDDLGDLATDELMDPGNREGEAAHRVDHGLDEDQANAITWLRAPTGLMTKESLLRPSRRKS